MDFKAGDRVKVTRGEHKDKTGTITEIVESPENWGIDLLDEAEPVPFAKVDLEYSPYGIKAAGTKILPTEIDLSNLSHVG